MDIVDTMVPITSERNGEYIRQLVQTYPEFRTEMLGQTKQGRPIQTLVAGSGPRKVIFTAAHHANEWITALILLKFAEDWGKALKCGGKIGEIDAESLGEQVTVYMVPMVDPDGVDLVNGVVSAEERKQAEVIAARYPRIPFPNGWKANLEGVDLNLNYPARWLKAREIKFRQGYTRPAPRDYVGRYPLSQPETRLLAGYTEFVEPALVLAFHSQGKEIYWDFDGIFVPGAEELGQKMAQVSGYTLAQPAPNSSNAGYKDWFIEIFQRPGYTVEVGRGENPLPISQFPEIYGDNLPLMITAALGK